MKEGLSCEDRLFHIWTNEHSQIQQWMAQKIIIHTSHLKHSAEGFHHDGGFYNFTPQLMNQLSS